MLLLQAPAPQLPDEIPGFVRRVKPGEVLRYAVQSEWTSPNGHATYDYQMRLEAEREAPEKKTRNIVARLENLRATYDEHESRSKLFGVLPFEFGPNGPPANLSAGGSINTFAFPLLAFTLPTAPEAGSTTLKIPTFEVKAVGKLSGSGKVLAQNSRTTELSLRFVFGGAPDAPVLEAKSVFAAPTGQLLRSEGTYTDPSGTLTFKIRRI